MLFFLSLSFLLSGCLSMAWTGYKKPQDSDFGSVGNRTIYMKIGRQNLNLRQWQAIKEATSDICDIFADPEFKQAVVARQWLASCSKVNGKADTISGHDLYKLLLIKIPSYSIHPHQPWHAEGQAENGKSERCNRVALSPDLIEGWYSPIDTIRSALINAQAHEAMHILSENFLDYDGRALCPDSLLVSYSIGNLAEEIWLKRHKK